MLWMTIRTLHYLTGCYQHKSSSAPHLRDWTDLSRETKRTIYYRFGSTAHFSSFPLCSARPESKQHGNLHWSSLRWVTATKGYGAKTQGGRNQNGNEGGQRENPAPSGSDNSDRPGDLLEQRATGGKRLSKWGVGRGGKQAFVVAVHQAALMDQSLQGTLQVTPRSKYVWATLPAATLLSFPIASLIDVDLLTCDLVLTTLKPKCLVVVM